MHENQVATSVLDSAFKIHRHLGPGLLESVYKECMFYDLNKKGVMTVKERPFPLIYSNVKLDIVFRVDLFVENKVIIEIKSVDEICDIHFRQIQTYLQLSNCKLGILINFNVILLKDGIRRVVNNL